MKTGKENPKQNKYKKRLIELYKSKRIDISGKKWSKVVAKDMFARNILNYDSYSKQYNVYENDVTEKKVTDNISRILRSHVDDTNVCHLSSEWIRHYCDYFGCSADYLLGIIKKPTHAQNDNIPLTLNAINQLREYQKHKDDDFLQGVLSTINILLDNPIAPAALFWIGMYLNVSEIKGYISKGKKTPFKEQRKSNPKQIIHNDLYVYTDSDEQVMIDDDIVRAGILNKIRDILDNIDSI